MDTPKSEANTPDHALHKDVMDLLHIMGQSLNAALLYGLDHKVASSSLDVSFIVATKFMEYHGAIEFSLEGHILLINGVSTEGFPNAGSFTTRLTDLKLLNFSFQPGFPAGEYRKFFTVLLTPPTKLGDQNGADLVQSLGLSHVQAKSFSYQRVSEGGSGKGTTPPGGNGAAEHPSFPDLASIVSFLFDTGVTPSASAGGDIRQLAKDPEKLAELILKTIEARADTTLPQNEETLVHLIAECVQKVAGQLLADPALKTQKGRKHAKQTLLLLEKSLAGRLHASVGEASAKVLTARLSELAGEMDLDALAKQYMKGRRAAGKAGEKIGLLIDRIQADPEQLAELQDHLIRDGLTPEGWQELTGKTAARGGASSPEIRDLIAETARQLALLSRITETRLSRLRDKLGAEDTPRQLSRREVLEILAELTQEISQPLTIVNGTVELIKSLRIGPLNDSQLELLGMVSESGDRMAQLVDSLMRIAGTPATLHPDQDILQTAYAQG
jgi:hypothetical protein